MLRDGRNPQIMFLSLALFFLIILLFFLIILIILFVSWPCGELAISPLQSHTLSLSRQHASLVRCAHASPTSLINSGRILQVNSFVARAQTSRRPLKIDFFNCYLQGRNFSISLLKKIMFR